MQQARNRKMRDVDDRSLAYSPVTKLAPEQTVLEWADKRGKNKKEYSRQLTSKTPKASTVWYLSQCFYQRKTKKKTYFK